MEAGLWVAGGLVLLGAIGRLPSMPTSYVMGVSTIAGGVLFGLGARVNRACVFGSVARLGSGEWAYLATAPGFFLGVLLADRLFPAPGQLQGASLVTAAPIWMALVAAALVLGPAPGFDHDMSNLFAKCPKRRRRTGGACAIPSFDVILLISR